MSTAPAPDAAASLRCLTVSETADALGVRPAMVFKYIDAGELAAFDTAIGGYRRHLRVSPDALRDFIARREASLKPPADKPRRKRTAGKPATDFFPDAA